MAKSYTCFVNDCTAFFCMFIYLIVSHTHTHKYASSIHDATQDGVYVCINHWRWRRHLISSLFASLYLHFSEPVSAFSCNTWTHLKAKWQRHYQQQQPRRRQRRHQHKKKRIIFQAALRCAFDDVSRFSTSRTFNNEWVLTDCKSRRLDLSFETVCVFFSL